jgi:hypothetical protein
LNFDRYSYNIAGAKLGDPASSVVLDTLWTGPPPPRAKLKVIERGGCDIAPLRLEDPAQAQRLEAYVWADQADRLQRLRAAIVITQTEGPRLDCADAAEWLVRRVGTAHGAATVLFHSVMWQYMPPASRTTAAGRIAALGEAATQNAPFAWLRMEPDPQGPAGEMTVWLTFWPGGETKRLAKVHPHGAEVTWFGV